jgi:hypothetical protein
MSPIWSNPGSSVLAHLRDEAASRPDARGKSVAAFRCRPPWDPNLTRLVAFPVAQLRHHPASHTWDPYEADHNCRWHRCDDIDPAADALLDEIGEDPAGILGGRHGH